MERHEIMEMMAELKLLGMRLAFDEVLANGVKRQHPAQQIIGDLLASEIAEKHARSIRYQVGAAKLPLAKELANFDFTGSPINEGLVRELAVGTFLSQQRNMVLVGGTGGVGQGSDREAGGKPTEGPARATSPWPSPAIASAPAPDAGSTPWWTWSTGWKRKARRGGRERSPTR